MDSKVRDILFTNYKHQFNHDLLEQIAEVGTYHSFPENTMLIDFGQRTEHMPLLISGAIKILREDDNGKELFLYFLEKGDTCTMTFTTAPQIISEIRAITEVRTELIMMPLEHIQKWMSNPDWQQFVFNSFTSRMQEMLEAIDTLAFMNLDQRLHKYLLEKASIMKSEVVVCSHEELALDLNTSRVVISRILKQLENKGLLVLRRGAIEVLTQLV